MVTEENGCFGKPTQSRKMTREVCASPCRFVTTSLTKLHPNLSCGNRPVPLRLTSGLVRHTGFCLSTVSYRPVASAANTRTGDPTIVVIPGTGSFGTVHLDSPDLRILKYSLCYPPCFWSKERFIFAIQQPHNTQELSRSRKLFLDETAI